MSGWPKPEAPVTQPDPSPGSPERTVTTHPAFAQISVSRASGTRLFYGSPHDHQYSVRLAIHESQLDRHLSNDWHHSTGRPIVEIGMTEAQWAELTTKSGVGDGVCCTLVYTEARGPIAGILETETRAERYAIEHDAVLTQMADTMTELRTLIEGSSLSKIAKGAMASKLTSIQNGLTSSIPFIKEQFAEFVEETAAAIRMSESGAALLEAQERQATPQIEAPAPIKDITPRVRERTRIKKEE